MAYDFFISFADRDKPVAREIYDGLAQAGLRCFNAHEGVAPGEDWDKTASRGVKESSVFVLVYSAAANASSVVRRELEHAAKREMPIIPFMIEAAAPLYLDVFSSSTEWMDATASPVGQHIPRLYATIRTLLAKTSKRANGSSAAAAAERGKDIHVRLTLTPQEAKYPGHRIRISDDRTLDIRIPPKVTDGTKLRLRGEGHPSPGGNGDVIVEILIRR